MGDTVNTAEYKHLDATGLSQVWSAILAGFATKDSAQALSDKLDTIEEGAQVNTIESIKVNGVALDITDKGVNVTVPTGALASLDKVSASNLDDALSELISSHATTTYVDDELAKKADTATTLAGYGIGDAYTKTETYTKDEINNAIDDKVKAAVAGVYRVKGSVAFENLPTEGMTDGDVYNVTDEFETTDAFEEGKGVSYPAGTNVVYVAADEKWDCMAGTYDFSEFVVKSDIAALSPEEITAICKIPEE